MTRAKAHGGANAIAEEQILAAAYDLLLAVGPKRMTMADIARKAEVSRATLYRRWSNVDQVVATLLTRELDTLAADAFDGGAGTARQRLVGAVVRIASRAREHPLLVKIVMLDPEFLMPYLLERRGTSTDHQLGMMEAALRDAAGDPSVRDGDPRELAQSVLLTTWSFVLTGPVLTGPDDADRLDTALYDLLDRYLAP